jgi:hypothetical protein
MRNRFESTPKMKNQERTTAAPEENNSYIPSNMAPKSLNRRASIKGGFRDNRAMFQV